MERIKQYIISHKIDMSLTLGSILITCLMHWIGFFDFLELKTYDYRFNNVRGPITGWRASDSTIIKSGILTNFIGKEILEVCSSDNLVNIQSESEMKINKKINLN